MPEKMAALNAEACVTAFMELNENLMYDEEIEAIQAAQTVIRRYQR